MPKNIRREYYAPVLMLGLSLFGVIIIWFQARDVQARWGNVPPAPNLISAPVIAFGDMQWAYRIYAVFLQNMGDNAGKNIPFSEYNYTNLTAWLYMLHAMDSRSSYSPFLAAFYFSSVKEPEKLRRIVDFLAEVGQKEGRNNWRWLGQAVSLARFELKDNELALKLAYKLAAIDQPNMPGWTKQMPAFILNNMGKKEGAYAVMLNILKSNAQDMHPNEVFFMRDYICSRLQNEKQAQNNPLCHDIKRAE